MKRKDVDKKYTIDFTRFYKTEDDFKADIKKVKELLKDIEKYRGKVTKSLFDVLEKYFKINEICEDIYVYSYLQTAIDVLDENASNKFSKAFSTYNECIKSMQFIDDEILKLNFNDIKKLIQQDDKLQKYEFYLEQLFHTKDYTLNESEEKLLSEYSETVSGIKRTYETLFAGDIKYPKIKDDKGNSVELTIQNYPKFMESKDRKVRKKAFETLNKVLKAYENTFASLLDTKLGYDIKISKIRGFKNPLDRAIYSYNMPRSVIDNLINIANDSKYLNKKYHKILKGILGYNKIHSYDLRYNPIEKSDKTYSVEDAKEYILKALGVYGTEYHKKLEELLNKRNVDYMPTDNKKSGAFQINTYRTGSFVFTNYNNKIDDILTLTHELGHAMHSVYTTEFNPNVYGDSSFLLVEIASLTNELLLCEYVLKNESDIYVRYEVLKGILDTILGNFFVGISRLLVQEELYKRKADGNAITASNLNELSLKYQSEYENNGLDLLEGNSSIWTKVSHYYSLHYNYHYSIGISVACIFASRIMNKEKNAKEDYIEFLKNSGRDFPVQTLKKYGVDLTDIKTFQPVLAIMKDKIKEFEDISNQLGE